MVVQYKILLFVFILALIPSTVFADEEKYKKQIIQMIHKEFQVATIELEKAIEKCDLEEKSSIPSVSLFKKINISQEEMMVALLHLGLKASSECITETKNKNFSYYLIKYQNILKFYNEPEYQDIDLSLVTHPSPGFKEMLQIRYNEISPEFRAALEDIPELLKPFNHSKLLDRIESELYSIK